MKEVTMHVFANYEGESIPTKIAGQAVCNEKFVVSISCNTTVRINQL